MAEAGEPSFPFTVPFSRGPLTVTFNSQQDIEKWVKDEQQFFNRFAQPQAQDQFTNGGNKNLNWLNTVAQAKSSVEAKTQLLNIKNQYIPSKSSIGKLVGQLFSSRDASLARAVFCEIETPNSIGWQPNNQLYFEAKTVATVYRTVGDPAALLESQAAVEKIRASFSDEHGRFEALIDQCEDDWESKIAGYEAKVALGAPRQYWETRRQKYEALARKDSSTWNWTMFAGLVVGSIMGIVIASKIIDAKLGLESTLSVMALFGTFISFNVWWLKQKLKDFRSHEHLAEDAAERVTMIETYSAMKGAGLQDADLAPILAALYRPAVAGLVEDGSPALPIEILMKSVGDRVGK